MKSGIVWRLETRRTGSSATPASPLLSREHLRHRLYYFLDETFIPKQADWLTLPLPDSLDTLYYLLRPLRLLFKFSWAFLSQSKSSQ